MFGNLPQFNQTRRNKNPDMENELPNAFEVLVPSHFDIPARLGGLASAQAIEVLLKCRAFVVKRSATDQGVKGQITWAKVGGVEKAWAMAVERAGFQ